MYVFIRSGVLLWREVWSKLFKLTRTFFFLSFRSGTLSSEALHPPTLLPHPPLHYPSGGFTILVSITLLLSTSALPSLSLSLHVAFCCAVSAPFSPSHCPAVSNSRLRRFFDYFRGRWSHDFVIHAMEYRFEPHCDIWGSRVVVRQEGETRKEARCWSVK